MKTATSRTLEFIRSRGWVANKVEQFNPYAGKFGVRKDLFGFADIVALGEDSIFAIQSCGSSFSKHHNSITKNPYVAKWLLYGGRVLLIGWRKVLKCRAGKMRVWMPRIREYFVEEGKIQFKDSI